MNSKIALPKSENAFSDYVLGRSIISRLLNSSSNLVENNSSSVFLCEESIVRIAEPRKLLPDSGKFHDFWSKIEFSTLKMSFPVKVMFYKVVPHKLSH